MTADRPVNRARSSPPRGPGRIIATTIFATTVAFVIAGKLVEMRLGRGANDAGLVEDTLMFAAFLMFPAVGTLVVSRQPRNAAGWVLVGIGALIGVGYLAQTWAQYSLGMLEQRNPAAVLAAWITAWYWFPLILSVPTLLPLLFPDGRPPSRRWRPVVGLAAAAILVMTVPLMVKEDLTDQGYRIRNPVGIEGLGSIEEQSWPGLVILPAVTLSVASLIVRFRRSRGDERQQLKWVAFAAMTFVVAVVIEEALAALTSVALPEVLFPIFLGSLPASIGVAMLKYRLYDIDVVINRTLVYGVLSAFLGAAYAALVVALQGILGAFGSGNNLAVAASTLAVAALFTPARRGIQEFIDHRFYRRKYDAEKTLHSFSTRLRDEVDIRALTHELQDVVQRTMQPRSVSVWLRAPGGDWR